MIKTYPKYYTVCYNDESRMVSLPVLVKSINIAVEGQPSMYRHIVQHILEAAKENNVVLVNVEDILEPDEYTFYKDRLFYIKNGFIVSPSKEGALEAILEIIISSNRKRLETLDNL